MEGLFRTHDPSPSLSLLLGKLTEDVQVEALALPVSLRVPPNASVVSG